MLKTRCIVHSNDGIGQIEAQTESGARGLISARDISGRC
jgi:hypothetical protein